MVGTLVKPGPSVNPKSNSCCRSATVFAGYPHTIVQHCHLQKLGIARFTVVQVDVRFRFTVFSRASTCVGGVFRRHCLNPVVARLAMFLARV